MSPPRMEEINLRGGTLDDSPLSDEDSVLMPFFGDSGRGIGDFDCGQILSSSRFNGSYSETKKI